MASNGLYGNAPTGATVAAPGAATSGLYGSGVTGQINQVPGAETVGLYGHNVGNSSSLYYFEYFVFQDSATQPATPTGGSWSFTTNTGTPPAGWSNVPPASITNRLWISIGLINSNQVSQVIQWSTPGTVTNNGSLPEVTSGTATPTGTPATIPALYVKTTDQSLWAYTSQNPTWSIILGGSGGASYLYQLRDVTLNESGQTWTNNLLPSASRSISEINDQQLVLNGTASALGLSVGDLISSQNSDTNLTVVVTAINGNTITCLGGGIYALWSSPSGIKQFIYKYGISVLANGRGLTWNGSTWTSSSQTLSSASNTLTLTTTPDVGTSVTTTAPIVNSNVLEFNDTTNVLTSTVNGVSATATINNNIPPTTNTLTNTVNTITSTVDGVSATAPAVNTVINTVSSNQLVTSVNGVASNPVSFPSQGAKLFNLGQAILASQQGPLVKIDTTTPFAIRNITVDTGGPGVGSVTFNTAISHTNGYSDFVGVSSADNSSWGGVGLLNQNRNGLDFISWIIAPPPPIPPNQYYTENNCNVWELINATASLPVGLSRETAQSGGVSSTLVFPDMTIAYGDDLFGQQAATVTVIPTIDAEISNKIGAQNGSLASFANVTGVTVTVERGGTTVTGLAVSDATSVTNAVTFLTGLGWSQVGTTGVYRPGASSDNLYLSNIASPTASQYTQATEFDVFTPGNTAVFVCSENDYLQSITGSFTPTYATLASNFQFRPAPNTAIRELAVEAIDAGTGISKTTSADGTNAIFANTGVLGLNGLSGAVALTSSDNTVSISTNNTTKTVDLRAHATNVVAGEVTAYNTGPVTSTNISYQIGVTGASNGAAIYIGTGTSYSTNETIIKPGTTTNGYTFGGQKATSMVSSFGTGQQEVTVTVNGSPSANVNLSAAFGDSTVDGANTPFFRRRGGGNLANPITFAAPGLPFTVNGTTVTIQYDYTLEPAGGAIPKVGEAMNFLDALDGAIPLNYNMQIIAVSLVSGTTYSVTIETFRTGNTPGHLRAFIVYHDQFPAYVSGSQAYADLLPLNGQSPALYTEYLPVGNTGLAITSIQQFQYGASNTWYATIVFSVNPQVTNVGFTNIDFSGSGINIPGAGNVTNLYSDTNFDATNHSIIVRMPVTYTGGAVTFTGITANIWVQSASIPANTAMGTGGKIRWNISPGTWYIDSALQPTGAAGNYGNPWQFGFYLPPATGFGDFCLGWDIALDSGIPIQSVLYTNQGIGGTSTSPGFWNNRHAINGAAASSVTPTLGQVLQAGNTTNGLDIVVSNGDDITVATAAQLVIADGNQGQVLGKTASGTGWVNTTSGTITGVTAGVGLTGGGTTGNVTVTLAPPTSTTIGGVKAGTNITIGVDGTISATGGGTGGGGVTSVATGYRLIGGPITTTGTIEYVRSWADYKEGWTNTPTLVTATGSDGTNLGSIYNYTGPWGTYYRFVPDTYTSTNDAIYSTLTGSTVSGLITRRNI